MESPIFCAAEGGRWSSGGIQKFMNNGSSRPLAPRMGTKKLLASAYHAAPALLPLTMSRARS